VGLGSMLAKMVSFLERRALVEFYAFFFAVYLMNGIEFLEEGGQIVVALSLALLLALRLAQVLPAYSSRRPETERPFLFVHLQLLLLCTVYLLIRITGGMESSLYPLLYLLLAAAGGLGSRWTQVLPVVSVSVIFELLLFRGSAHSDVVLPLVHLAAILSFPFLLTAVNWSVAEGIRRKMAAEQELERRRVEQEAEEYRRSGGGLTSSGTSIPAEKRLLQRQRSSAKELDDTVQNLLDMIRFGLRPNTVAYFLLSLDEKTVRLKDADSNDEIIRDPMPAGEGIIGAILKKEGAVSLNHIRDNSHQLTYYRGRVPVKTFLGVPVMEKNNKRGVLLVDRRVDIPFGEDDEEFLKAAAKQLWKNHDNEHVLAIMDEELYKNKQFYESSKQLNRAVNQQEVIDEVLASVRRIYSGVDFAAMVLEETSKGKLLLRGVNAAQEYERFCEDHRFEELEGKNNLCAQAILKGTILPHIAYWKMEPNQRSVFGRKMPLPGIESLKVFPLKVALSDKERSVPGEEKKMGVLLVASKDRHFFPENPSRAAGMIGMFETLSNIAALAIQSAQRYEQLERQATTDGLTGLNNHRHFQERLEKIVAESLRYQRSISLILADVDHFKKINDTYGHPVGDEVLKRVARVLCDWARETDMVCRYGGEEFTVILPQTDPGGAKTLAERFREEVKKQRFTADGKEFGVTISIGICTLPDFARHKQELIDRADQTLYHAKHSGRDRTVHFAELKKVAVLGSPT
jgi:two-component system, cell cycle response regulator